MSVTIPNLNTFIVRLATILRGNKTIFPDANVGKNLVNKILEYDPALAGSPDTTFVPYIFIGKSKGQPITRLDKAGRDTIDKAGGTLYQYEFYCVCVAEGVDIPTAQQRAYDIAVPVQQAFEQNLRLTKLDGTEPLCRTVKTFLIPFLMKLNVPSIQAVNVVVRAEVYVNLR